MSQRYLAAIEAGGTKILCALADAAGRIGSATRIATTTPDETFGAMAAFFAGQPRDIHIEGCGIASFGPLDLDPSSHRYGSLTTTPKAGWQGVAMLSRIREMLGVPTRIDTDVNCAALAEGLASGAAAGLDRFCYITVGTGIGVGIVDRGKTMSKVGHAEAGHIRVGTAPGDTFVGTCPSHGDCVEGLACGPALQRRWGRPAEELPASHVAWEHEAWYIAALCANLSYSLRPQRIVIGGGVMGNPALPGQIRRAFAAITAGYALDRWSADPENYIVPPSFTDPSSGLVGALLLAREAADAR